MMADSERAWPCVGICSYLLGECVVAQIEGFFDLHATAEPITMGSQAQPRRRGRMKTDVLVIGAGLSGLRISQLLSKHQRSVTLLDARDRLGGRILSEVPSSGGDSIGLDMGPSWFWPWQQRMLALMHELELEGQVYEQYSDGVAVAENQTGQLVKQAGIASMAGSLRIDGGLRVLINALGSRLDGEHILNNSLLTQTSLSDDGVEALVCRNGETVSIHADYLVIAAPPRVIARSVSFRPQWDVEHIARMQQTPTWMAGQAKLVALYSAPFWREQGLSGDGVSAIGPLAEIHDASAAHGAPYALFGFVGVPVEERAGCEDEIKAHAVSQLVRMFGAPAATPIEVFYKDWAEDELTASNADRAGARAHAQQTVDTEPHWGGRLFWAGSETASVASGDNGYLEGALAAADRVVEQIMQQ